MSALLTALTVLTGLGVAGPASALPLNNPPAGNVSIIAFPQRDFVSAAGYLPDDRVVVRVVHSAAYGGGVVSTGEAPGQWLAPQADPADAPGAFSGLVEVNHPGGYCWDAATPDIRPGDRVQIEVMANASDPARVGLTDETTVANITARRPVKTAADTVVIHGTAVAADGASQLPVTQLEQRLVAPGDQFARNGRRTLRATSAGGDGTLAYDAPGSTSWTATYSGLSASDVSLALGAESRGMWLGNAVLPALETTVYEIGALTAPGPTPPCTAPLEVLPPPPGSELVPPSDPTNLVASISNSNTVTLTWTASTDNVGVVSYGIYRNGTNIFTVQNPDAEPPAPTTFVDPNTPPGDYTYQVKAFDAVGNGSQFSNTSNAVTAVQQVDVNTFPPNDPPSLPINIIVFPSRDFISPSGFLNTDVVSVQLLRRNPAGRQVIVSSADGIVPVDGFAEVNHPGGACWSGVTPDIRSGDVVRTIAYNPDNIGPGNPDGIRSVDTTTVAGVTAFQPVVVQQDDGSGNGVVKVHGTALGANGKPLPLDQIEQRMIATHGLGLWDLNGRRALRASANADGTLTYDTSDNPMGVNWTATYSGLSAADVTRMGAADTRIHWLGRNPLLLNEATIFENAPGTNPPGPAGPACTRPLEQADVVAPSTPGGFAAAQDGPSSVTLSWQASTDDWYVAGYRIYVDGVGVANSTTTSYTLTEVTPGSHRYSVRAYDTASPRGPGVGIIAQISSGLGQLYGNLSDPTPELTLAQADVTAPSVPADLTATTGVGQVHLTWSPSTDDTGVAGYGVYRDGTLVGTVTAGTSFTDSGLAVGSYAYRVDAFDAVDNRSARSAPVTANVTAAVDVVPPSVPTNVTASTSPDVHGRDVTVAWAASTDNVGVSGYRVYRDGVRIATVNGSTVSFTDTSLPSGTYAYTVDAIDSAGNASVGSAPPATAVVANDPPVAPHSVIAFPARDFISATGFTPGASYTFSLIRGGRTFSAASLQADATGLVEVNHPGGTCWTGNTPDLRAGDVVRITDDATGVADQTTVADVTADRPIATGPSTIVVHGTAQTAAGQQIPVAQLESRLITGTANAFDVNGRRVLRAGGAGADGTLSYDAAGSTRWTATYTGLSANDVFRAVGGTSPAGTVFTGAESRANWLGRDPLALTESTIFENGPGVVGGPSAPCTAPAESPVAAASFTPASVAFPNTRFLPAPAATSAARTVTFSNGGGAALRLTSIYLAGHDPGDFVRSGGTCPSAFPATLAAGASCTVTLTFKPTALGLRQANVSFSGNAANTTDLTVPLTGTGFEDTAPSIAVSPTSRNFGTVNGGATVSQVFTVTNTGTNTAAGLPLRISAVGVSGANAADFTVTGNTCAGASLPQTVPSSSCTVTVRFAPGARGARSANLTLAHNAAPVATSTSVALTGTGGNGAVLAFSSSQIKFGTVNRNTTKDQTISLKNSGNVAASLSLASFTATGTGFTKVSTTCGTLAPGGSCNVIVRFTAPNTVATFNGQLAVTAANGMPTTATTALSATTK